MKYLAIIAVFIFIFWIAGKIYSWDEEKNDGFGCGMLSIVCTILMFILSAVAVCKSCISNAGKSPSYDYYDYRAR